VSFPNLSAIAVRERSVTLFFLILSLVGGLYAFNVMGRAEDPSFTVRVMVVSVVWPGATPGELQDQVVDTLEKEIQQVPDLEKIETTTRPGRSDMLIQFHDYTPSSELPASVWKIRG